MSVQPLWWEENSNNNRGNRHCFSPSFSLLRSCYLFFRFRTGYTSRWTAVSNTRRHDWKESRKARTHLRILVSKVCGDLHKAHRSARLRRVTAVECCSAKNCMVKQEIRTKECGKEQQNEAVCRGGDGQASLVKARPAVSFNDRARMVA